MKVGKTTVVAGSAISFVAIFFLLALAMGLLRHGVGPMFQALVGKAPSVTETSPAEPGSDGTSVAENALAPAASPAGPAPAGSPDTARRAEEKPAEPPPLAAEGLAREAGSGAAAPESSFTRAEALVRLEEALRKREAEVAEEKARLLALQTELSTATARLDSLQETAIGHLARVYGSMRPDAAAGVLSHLPTDLQVAIVSRMEERSAGKVLGAMNPVLAAHISAKLGKGDQGR